MLQKLDLNLIEILIGLKDTSQAIMDAQWKAVAENRNLRFQNWFKCLPTVNLSVQQVS